MDTTNRYKVILVDDEVEALKRLHLFLGKVGLLDIVGSYQNGMEALDGIQKNRPDIVFIDIEMPEMNGLEVLQNCSVPYPYFVFVTAYDAYAVEAFEKNAVDYILKPYSKERIEQAVHRATDIIEKERLAKNAENYKNLLLSFSERKPAFPDNGTYVKRIAVKSVGKTSFIEVKNILWIESSDQYVEVHTAGKTIVVRESMDQLEQNLNPREFFRIHRSYIVSLDQVEALEYIDKHTSMTVLKNGKRLKISNSRKQEFKKRMGI